MKKGKKRLSALNKNPGKEIAKASATKKRNIPQG